MDTKGREQGEMNWEIGTDIYIPLCIKSHMGVRVGLCRKLSTEELMLLNCGVGEDSYESLGLQGGPASPS